MEASGVRIWPHSLEISLSISFISIVLVAYLGQYIQYEAWRWIHRLIYLAYIFGLFHVLMIMGNRLLSFLVS